MYSFAPAAANTPMSMGSLVLVLIMLGVVCVMAHAASHDLGNELGLFERPLSWVVTVVACFLFWVAVAMYDHVPSQPKNEVVMGTLVDTAGETVVTRSGKSSYSYDQVMVVRYAVPEGVVTLRGSYGVVYPKSAILYKN